MKSSQFFPERIEVLTEEEHRTLEKLLYKIYKSNIDIYLVKGGWIEKDGKTLTIKLGI